jgi:hypothetical protein
MRASKETIIAIFKAALYDFTEEQPKGRLIFHDTVADENIQLYIDRDKDNLLEKSVELIVARANSSAEKYGKKIVQDKIKEALGL